MVTDASRGRRRQQEAHLFESLSLQNNTGDAEEGPSVTPQEEGKGRKRKRRNGCDANGPRGKKEREKCVAGG